MSKDISTYLTSMTPLESAFAAHKSNKLWHGYLSFYEKLFQEKKDAPVHFLEIGIDQGGSLFAWQDYFTNGTIYGLDLQIPDCIKYQSKILYSVADQSKPDQLRTSLELWGNPIFDSIVDDGGHLVSQQRISMETLWSSLKSGGYYVIEDLHTNIKALQTIHPHLSVHSPHIDETPTVHDKIYNTMAGSKNEFGVPVSEIAEVYYFHVPHTLSLSCAFKKA